ncbi:MAG: c-type cytochrome [Gemmataceae bacterium]|nr:c-type cytochrome [Gemmataceae bacterium]
MHGGVFVRFGGIEQIAEQCERFVKLAVSFRFTSLLWQLNQGANFVPNSPSALRFPKTSAIDLTVAVRKDVERARRKFISSPIARHNGISVHTSAPPEVPPMRLFLVLSAAIYFTLPAFGQLDVPKAADPRLVVELVAQSPDIVHPVSCDFDHQGRLLVIESHTHFAPKDYKGPKFDRIRAFELHKDGKPGFAKVTTFYEGTRHTMDLAVHPDGSVYVATRNEILRLQDTKQKGVPDKVTRIIFLDTKGDYPHNGLSGLCFDSKGDLTFGMGENLGAFYALIGSDGKKFTGQGDGGHIFHCTADGKKLRKVATGFWNPFGNCRDIYGRLFCVDNDPDQAPPCRMLHVVEGGDYGFRFCYGRSGKHPFQSWHGELPGTLPMMTGVGEAPCEILSYESDGLPKEYLGQLLVTSWADHRVERYQVKPHGASFKAERLPFVQGGNNFRPVGMCVAPDGSIYITDWVLSNYTLHGKGAIWHIRAKDDTSRERKRPADPREAILSLHRPLREAAARKLADNDWELLVKLVERADPRVRAAALTALMEGNVRWKHNLHELAVKDDVLGMRELSVRMLGTSSRNESGSDFLGAKNPGTVRVEAIQGMSESSILKLDILSEKDPFLHHAAVRHFAGRRLALMTFAPNSWKQAEFRLMYLLATENALTELLKDPVEDIRFLAVKRVADSRLVHYRVDIEKSMQDPKLSVRMYQALATALARIDGKDVNENSLADYFAKRLTDDATPIAQRATLLRQVPASHKALTVDLLTKLLKSDDGALKLETVRALVEHTSAKRHDALLGVFRDAKLATPLRAFAMVGLSDRADLTDELQAIANDKASPLRNDAVRALIGIKGAAGGHVPEKNRPAFKDIDAWSKRLEGPADAEAGARVFFHPKVGACFKCHRIDGRGADVGPDLSSIGRVERRQLLESILQPSNTVAPRYQNWYLETADGKTRNGVLLHTQLDEYTYLDANGGRFKLKTGDIVEQRAVPTSIMPEALVDGLMDQELRDLLAYLQTRK